MAVQPDVGERQQVVVGVAEARRAAARAVARVGALHARREVGDDDGAVPAAARPLQLGLEPGPARERLGAHRLGVERPAAPRRLHERHEVAAGAHRLGAADGAEQVEVAPARRADDADRACRRASATTMRSRSSSVMPSARTGRAAPAVAASMSRPSYSWLPATKSDRLRPAAKARQRLPGRVDVAGEHEQLGARRRLGSYGSVSRCRSERSCSRIRPSRARGAVALLELPAAAARAGVVAADLRRRAPHRVDLVAQRQRQLVQLGDAGDDLRDRVVERLERQLARDQRGACPARRRRQEAEQPRQGERDLRVVELVERRAGGGPPARSRRPRAGSRADRIVRRCDRRSCGSAGARLAGRRRAPRLHRPRRRTRSSRRLEDERIEAAVLRDRPVERSMTAQDQRARTLLLGRRLGLAPAMAAGVEDERQPRVGVEQRRLDDDAAQEAVEHDDVERLERLGDAGEELVELGEFGVAQVLRAGRDRAARRRRRFRLAHRRGGACA